MTLLSGLARRTGLLSTLIALVLAVTSWLYIHRDLPWYLWSGDAKEYAEMARRLANGEGFTTGVIYPAAISLGVTRDHPAVTRPPAWSVLIGAFFAVLGPYEWVVHWLVLACHFVSIACAMALARALAGPWTGLVTGVAVATNAPFLIYALDGASEPLFAALVTLSFLLCAKNAHPFWLGLASGLAYLTRYNGMVLLPALLLLVAYRNRRVRPLLACSAGFVLVTAPWWIRNLIVAGNPVYSLLNLNLYMSPEFTPPHGGLLYRLSPDLDSPAAVDPVAKAVMQLPQLLARWPLANANLVACLGVLLACIRRETLSVLFAGVAAASTLGLGFALLVGRYFMPLVPTLLALGAAGWARYGGRLRVPALGILLALPLLPEFPPPLADVALQRTVATQLRQSYRQGENPTGRRRRAVEQLSRCLGNRDIVITEDGTELAWLTDAIAIQLPATEAEFWTIVDEYPVRYARIGRLRSRISRDAFEARFTPRPDCGPDLYERRDAEQDESMAAGVGSS